MVEALALIVSALLSFCIYKILLWLFAPPIQKLRKKIYRYLIKHPYTSFQELYEKLAEPKGWEENDVRGALMSLKKHGLIEDELRADPFSWRTYKVYYIV